MLCVLFRRSIPEMLLCIVASFTHLPVDPPPFFSLTLLFSLFKERRARGCRDTAVVDSMWTFFYLLFES